MAASAHALVETLLAVLALGAAVTEVVEGAAPGLGVRGRRPTTM
jgi:hypothetical protein